MIEPALHHVQCQSPSGGHRMAFWQWGHAEAPRAVVCVHGLSRQGRDFDVLARALVARSAAPLRVICPDIVGRGKSDWLADPAGYQLPQYLADVLALLAHLNEAAPLQILDWVGSSMGGLIGMAVCSRPQVPVAVRRMVLNDVGPVIQWPALERIGQYLGQTGHFDTVEQAADALWAISASFGPHTRSQWTALCRPMLRPLPEGGFTLHYDPAIAVPFRSLTPEAATAGEAALWQLYDAIEAKVLLLRGERSDLLAADTAQAMALRGPGAPCVTFAGVGHAPTLVADDQVDVVAEFLLST